jgi:hypothetical protein
MQKIIILYNVKLIIQNRNAIEGSCWVLCIVIEVIKVCLCKYAVINNDNNDNNNKLISENIELLFDNKK